ncbi:MAG: hypothetical protein C0404_10065 [Verrucomicrobia bacterium]|nr:hypothetical protein [Verrucomicrobiota bacterium]
MGVSVLAWSEYRNQGGWRMKRNILVVVLGVGMCGSVLAGTYPTWTQEHYRWRNDDGSETAATWKANADTAITGATRGTNIRLRFSISNTGSASGSYIPTLEFSTSTTGTWTTVAENDDGLVAFKLVTTSNYANNAATTGLLTGTGTFAAGKCVERPSSAIAGVTINTNQHANFEFCIQATAKARGSATYYFRTMAGTYSKYAQLTMAADEATEPPVIKSALTASASTQAPFNYTILASGSEPITYSATGLPAGLGLDGAASITGTATVAGSFPVGLSARNAYGTNNATVALGVMANVAPVASNQTVSIVKGGEILITLAWSDVDNPLLSDHSFTVVTQPVHGTVESYDARNGTVGNQNKFYFRAATNVTGADSITWKCRDREEDSNIATASITIAANHAPVAEGKTAIVTSGTRGYCVFTQTDADAGQTISYVLVSPPSHGFVEMPAPTGPNSSFTVYYTSYSGYAGPDSFKWKCNDGADDSNIATVTITVNPSLPVPEAQTAATAKNTAVRIVPLYKGGGGYSNKLSIPWSASHGKVTVTNGDSCLYVPGTDYVGQDVFSWRIVSSNSTTNATSDTAQCTIWVKDSTTADWPQWRSDEWRSGVSPQALPDTLHLQWRRDLPPVAPAWISARSTLKFDNTYRPVVLGKRLFVGLNSEDCLVAMDTDTGEEHWRFFTEGPIRCPPVAVDGKVIFGSDDGCMYCVSAADGTLNWKFTAKPTGRKVMGNRRLISAWPVRGMVYRQGRLYFTAGLWSMDGVFMFCLDAASGAVVWKNDSVSGMKEGFSKYGTYAMGGMTPQGQFAFSLSGSQMYVPCGYINPRTVDPATGVIGERLGWLNSEKGWYVDYHYYGDTEPLTVSGGGRSFTASLAAGLGVSGTVGSMLVADGKFFAVTTQGSIYCFGGTPEANPPIYLRTRTPLPDVADEWRTAVADIFFATGYLKEGLAYVWGIGSGRMVDEMARQAPGLKIVAVDPDAVKVQALRTRMAAAGLYGTQVVAIVANPLDAGFAPYQAGLIVSEDAAAAGIDRGQEFVEKLYRCLRPFGGEARLFTSSAGHDAFAAAAAGLPLSETARAGSFTRFARSGMTLDQELADYVPPLGLLWYGDSWSLTTASCGRVNTKDIYTGLIRSLATPGTEPVVPDYTPPSKPNPMTDQVHGSGSVLGGKGCGTSRYHGPLVMDRMGGMGFNNREKWSGSFILSDIRSDCSQPVTTYAGNGVLYSVGNGCGCNFPLSGAYPAFIATPEVENWMQWWEVRTGLEVENAPIKRLGVNFGAPGERYVSEENLLWIHHHPNWDWSGWRSPEISVNYHGNTSRYYHHMLRLEKPVGKDRRWVAASGVKGMTGITVRVAWPIVALRAGTPPVIDGRLDDTCWDGKAILEMPAASNVTFSVRYDDDNLYVSGQQPVDMASAGSTKWKVWLDSDDASGYANVMTIAADGVRSATKISTNLWSGAVTAGTNQPFVFEMAIPWSEIQNWGIWKEQLLINVQTEKPPLSTDPCLMQYNGGYGRYCPVYFDEAKGPTAQTRAYTIRMYFAETEGANVGERVFDLKLQGQTVLKDFDINAAAGGKDRQLIKEFTGVQIRDRLDIAFESKVGEPMISGVELVGTYGTLPNMPPVPVISAVPGTNRFQVVFSARKSYDPDGQIRTCSWNFGDNHTSSSTIVTNNYATNKTYTIQLNVQDEWGLVSSAKLALPVGGATTNFGPQFLSGPTALPRQAIAGQSVEFSAVAGDTNGDSLAYIWTFGDGVTNPAQTTSSAQHAYTATGVYTAKVSITDGVFTNSGTVAVTVVALTQNQTPVVSITNPISGVYVAGGAGIGIGAVASDADGTIAKVIFYADSTVIGEDAAAPYAVTWNGAAAGGHVLTALAVDNVGATGVSTSVSVTVGGGANQDANSDGLPDAWQILHFGSATSPNAAPQADYDGDGMSNMAEYVAGTDPADAKSKFQVSGVRSQNGAFGLGFQTVAGKTYGVLGNGDLIGTSQWMVVTNGMPGTGGYVEVNDPDVLTRKFYRITVK